MMYKNKFAAAAFWVFTALTAFMIFYLSAMSADDSSEVSGGLLSWLNENLGKDFTDFFIRKFAHGAEFCVLGFFCCGAFLFQFGNKKICLLSPFFCILYAVSDEVHQLFVPGRACRFWDVLIDSGGIIIGSAVIYGIYMLIVRLKKSKKQVDN